MTRIITKSVLPVGTQISPGGDASCDLPVPTKATPKTHVVPAGHGHAFNVKKGEHFRIIDLHGKQVVDMVAWVEPFPSCSDQFLPPSPIETTPPNLIMPHEYMSASNTRYHLHGVHPTISETLYTNTSRPLFKLHHDTYKTHDLTFMCCHPEFYAELGLPGHRSCAANIAEAVSKLKGRRMEHMQVPDPFNTFQNTPNYTLKPLGAGRKGDFVEWEVLEDALVAISSCPFEVDGFNGGKVTDVAVVTGISE